jgi:sec-independent protein translocase protein TatA
MFGRIGIWELLLILAIVILIFGTKKMRNLGGDLGAALRNFKSAMREGDAGPEGKPEDGKKLPDSGAPDSKKPDGQ